MINKIINWIFSSFFRTLGRILVYIFIALIIFIIMNGKVKAVTNTDWYNNIDYTITRGEFYNWSSSTAYNQVASGFINNDFYNTSPLTTYNNGISIVYFLNQYLDPDYLYNVTTYICSLDFNISSGDTGLTYPFARTSSGYPGVLTEPMIYSYTTSSALSTAPITGDAYTGCRQYTSLIQPSVRSSWFTLKFTSSSSVKGYYYVLGYNLDSLGIADNVVRSEIQNIVDNSGLASASSVEEVQNSVEQVQAEMKEVNSSIDEQTQQQQKNHEETMNYLTDDSAPESDISSLGNVQGLLPAGPVDSLLNIPFKFLSIITSSMSGTCVPLSGTFVFDSTLTLPCFSEMIYDEVPEYLMFFINLIPSAFILIKYFKYLYKKIERAVSMNTTTDDEWGVL